MTENEEREILAENRADLALNQARYHLAHAPADVASVFASVAIAEQLAVLNERMRLIAIFADAYVTHKI
jgi:hypothetical protein